MSFVVIEGLDASGKGTQIERLRLRLVNSGKTTHKISFPDYESPSSSLVKMYLGGEFGESPSDVNPYAGCVFYAVDRFASYKKHWGKHLDNGDIVIADRYTTSNIVFQMSKLPKSQWDAFIEWVEDLEYNKMGLPKPLQVIYLDMPPLVSQQLLKVRYKGDENKKDIHEKNVDFLIKCRESAFFAAEKLGWNVISCAKDNVPRSMDDIEEEIFNTLKKVVQV